MRSCLREFPRIVPGIHWIRVQARGRRYLDVIVRDPIIGVVAYVNDDEDVEHVLLEFQPVTEDELLTFLLQELELSLQ